MDLSRVGKHLPEGVRALVNFIDMLSEAASACKVSARQTAAWTHNGFLLDGLKYWFGLLYDTPEWLWFRTRCRIDPEAASRLGVGEVTEESWIPGRARWSRGAQLDSEEVHFFSRSKVSQIQWLETFLRECLAMARSIETPDQPPLPEEPEGT